MDFFMKYLSETVEAINSYIEKDINIISVKSVRAFHNIKSSNRSKIGFIWRSLKYLEQQDILRVNGTTNPKKYKIVPIEKIDIKQVLKEGL